MRPLHNYSIRHSGLDLESRGCLIILDSGVCPGPNPGFVRMTKLPVLCSFSKVYLYKAEAYKASLITWLRFFNFTGF